MNPIIEKALRNGKKALNEYESKLIVQGAGILITQETVARTKEEAVDFADKIGYPVVLKGSSDSIAHKTESGLVKLNLMRREEVETAYDYIQSTGAEIDGILVQEMIKGSRELVIGMNRDPQFGPCVMFGLGGIFAEALRDVTFRVAPLSYADADEMIEEIKTKQILGAFRGGEPVDRELLKKALVGIGNLAMNNDAIREIDINPLIIHKGKPIAVDALVLL